MWTYSVDSKQTGDRNILEVKLKERERDLEIIFITIISEVSIREDMFRLSLWGLKFRPEDDEGSSSFEEKATYSPERYSYLCELKVFLPLAYHIV